MTKPSSLTEVFTPLPPISADHVRQWKQLWHDSVTPWDRSKPSWPLIDALTRHPELSRPIPLVQEEQKEKEAEKAQRKPRALVPGCGRGWDVLLLAGWGFDVVGVDVAEGAVAEAERVKGEHYGKGEYAVVRGGELGEVRYIVGNFFAEGLKKEIGMFDFVFDYTFLCALPIALRPKWAITVSSFLHSSGHLLCLEFPLGRLPSLSGPPHGLKSSVYVALLADPGVDISYDEKGEAVREVTEIKETALVRIGFWRPERTHVIGYDREGNVVDMVSLWEKRA